MKKIILLSLLPLVQIWAQENDTEMISKATKSFSRAYMDGDYDALVNHYCEDGKIFPAGVNIIEGRAAIKDRWTLHEGWKVVEHRFEPEEVKIIQDHAYDYGYYYGTTQKPDGSQISYKGKYVVVWRKEGDNWKIFLDIWNRVEE